MKHTIPQQVKDFQHMLKEAGLDGYISLGCLEVSYFMGLMNSGCEEAILLITPRQVYAITKQLMVAKLQQIGHLKIVVAPGDMLSCALDLAVQKKLTRLAFNPSAADFVRGEKLAQAGLNRLEGCVEELRKSKYPYEQAILKKSCHIAAEAFNEVKPKIKTGMTEKDVATLLALAMMKRGADSIPFNIVCFGENCADCHHLPSEKRRLKKNDAVLLDFGCFYQGYCSDMTRSWWHGDKEPAEYRKIWHLVQMAKDAAVSRLRAGLPVGDVDKAARSIIEDAGYGEYFIHTTGHGVGLEVHEAPIARKNAAGELEENSTLTVEPGIYLPGKFGVRLEDSYLITKTGSKNLTKN